MITGLRADVCLGLLAAAVICLAVGCSRDPDPGLGDETHLIVFSSRNLQTGRFEAFKIEDPAFLERLRAAFLEDLTRPGENSRVSIAMSVNHVLTFHDSEGNVAVFAIKGDRFILVNRRRFYADGTIAVLKDAHAKGAAQPISSERARHLAPELGNYLD